MIVVDLNLLIHAVNEDSPHHAAAVAWWAEQLNGTDTDFARIPNLRWDNPLSA